MEQKGRFEKGKSANPGGRPRGSKNLFNKHAKDAIKKAFNVEILTLKKDLAKMAPKDKWAIMIQLMKYVMPTQTETKNKMSGEMKYEISYNDEVKDDFELGDTTIDQWIN